MPFGITVEDLPNLPSKLITLLDKDTFTSSEILIGFLKKHINHQDLILPSRFLLKFHSRTSKLWILLYPNGGIYMGKNILALIFFVCLSWSHGIQPDQAV